MVKEFLESVRQDWAKVEAKQNQIDMLQAKLLQGVNFDDKGSSTSPSDTVNQITIKTLELKKELEQQIDDILDNRKRAMRLIDTLDEPVQIEILYKRFLENESWSNILRDTSYSRTMIFANCRQAIDKLEQRGEL